MKSKQMHLKSVQLDAFGREISAIGNEIKSRLGDEDLIYLKKVQSLSRVSELLGRGLIYLSFDPLTWSAGVMLLGIHHQLETGELGHSALHGAWDGLKGAESFDSRVFRWKTPVDEAAWRYEHNILHHQYTNIVGRDPDLNYGPYYDRDFKARGRGEWYRSQIEAICKRYQIHYRRSTWGGNLMSALKKLTHMPLPRSFLSLSKPLT